MNTPSTKKNGPKNPSEPRLAPFEAKLIAMIEGATPDELRVIARVGEKVSHRMRGPEPKATRTERTQETIAALIEEAQGNLETMCAIFAATDGDLASGNYSGSPPERRERFNRAVSDMDASLSALSSESAVLVARPAAEKAS